MGFDVVLLALEIFLCIVCIVLSYDLFLLFLISIYFLLVCVLFEFDEHIFSNPQTARRVAWIGGPWAAFRDTSKLQTMAWRYPRHTRLRFLLFPRLFSVLMLCVYVSMYIYICNTHTYNIYIHTYYILHMF
jgi:hypothetical protein